MKKTKITLADIKLSKEDILNDYRIANESRQASLLGRREVLTGKAKFGIFGDGKEVPQLAMARAFKKGDWRSGSDFYAGSRHDDTGRNLRTTLW